jgi:hypothetical protein
MFAILKFDSIFSFFFNLNYYYYYYYTILRVPPSLHTIPAHKPAADVGIFIIARQFTCVVQDAIAVIQEPIMNVHVSPVIELDIPPNIPEAVEPDDMILLQPPPTVDLLPDAALL